MPTVRVRKNYANLGDEDAPPNRQPTSNPGSEAVRASTRPPTTRRRTLTSIFNPSAASNEPTPTSERPPQVPSTSSPTEHQLPIPTVITPDPIDAPAREFYPEAPATLPQRASTAPRRSVVVDHITSRTAQRRRGSITARQVFSLDTDIPALRTRGVSSASEAGPSRTLPQPIDTTHLGVPSTAVVDGDTSEDGQPRARNYSFRSARGGEGTNVGLSIPENELRGTIVSSIRASAEEHQAHRYDHDVEGHPDDEEAMESDYTTEGSDIEDEEHHLDEVVDHLDVIDPEVAMVSHLSNAANSILIPRLPIYSRRPIVTLPTLTPTDTLENLVEKDEPTDTKEKLKSKFKRHHKDQDELDAHVAHVLKRRAKIRRTARGIWQFLKTPAGIVVGLYGFAVVFWGAAIVLFLLKWINLHNSYTQGFWVEISSQVVNALFTVTGVGLIPWRVMDTYKIMKIWHYKSLDRKLRKEKGLPPLEDEDDLPDPLFDPNFTHVLTEKQQKDLRLQQKRFSKSQTWYRAHATDTHRAFPISTALLICLLTDANSVFQCLLCGCMWGLNRYTRPAWTTGTLIPCAFLCGIAAGVFIARGGSKTKKTAEVEARLRKALAEGRSSKVPGSAGVGAAPGVYAQRAGLVGIIPMGMEEEENEADDEGADDEGPSRTRPMREKRNGFR